MRLRKVLKLATLIAAGVGALSAASVTSILAVNSSKDSALFAAESRHYKGEWYNEGALVYQEYFTRGQNVEYLGPTPTKVDYTGEKIYIFSGWDTTGDGLPDIPTFKAYRNFKANATYTGVDASLLEKIDWQKLLEILMDADIDLEALLARLGLSPEDIARLLGLNVLTVTSNVKGPAYLRTESFKDYNKSGHNWTDADYYPLENISEGSVNPLQYTANKLSGLRNDPLIASYCQQGTYQIKYNKTGGKYPVVAFETENNQHIPSDSYSLVSVGEDKTYTSNGFALIPCTEETVIAGLLASYSNDTIRKDELVYRDYVKKEYLGINDDYKTYFRNLASQLGVGSNNVGQAVTAFTEYLTNNFTLEYKHNEFPKSSDPLMYFMNEAKVADSNYFASAMTLFLRSLGYPARYTQGYMAAIAEENVETDVTALQAYSWCEVYVDGVGWMNADGAEYLLVKLFSEYYELPEEALALMDFTNKGTSRKLDHIYLGNNTKYDYVGGSNFSEDDIELIAVYDDGFEERVKPCFVTTPDISDYKNYYTRDVMVLYEYLSDIKSVIYTINVTPAKVESLNITNNYSYTVVSTVSATDFIITGNYTNGKTYYIDPNQVSIDVPYFTEPGDYEVYFSYTEYYGGDPNDSVTVTATYLLHIDPEPYIVRIQPTVNLPRILYTDQAIDFYREDWLAYRSNGEITFINILDEYILNPEILSLTEPGYYTIYIQVGEQCEIYEYSFEVVENVIEEFVVILNYDTFYMDGLDEYYLSDDDFVCYVYYLNGIGKQLFMSDLTISDTVYASPGYYYVDFSYSETYTYSGTLTFTQTVEIYVNTNHVVDFYPIDVLEASIHVGQEVTEDLFANTRFTCVRTDGSEFTVTYDDARINFNFNSVDRYTPGVYEVEVTYSGDVYGNTLYTYLELDVVGIESFEGHFDGMPESLLTKIEYTEDDYYSWELYATVTYFNGSDYEESYDIYPGDYRLTIDLATPFAEPGSYSIVLTFNDGYEEVSDSNIVSVIEFGVEDVIFDLSSLEDSYYYTESIDHNDVSATVYYVNNTSSIITYESGLMDYDTTSLGGSPEQLEVTFTITIDGVDYSDSKIVEIIRPIGVQFDQSFEDETYYINNEITLSDIEVFVVYDDGELIGASSSEITFSFAEEKHLGYNTLVVTFDDGTYTFQDTIEIILYDVTLDVEIEEKEYFEGDVFDGEYIATLHYNADGIFVHEDVDVTDEIIFTAPTLVGGENSLSFSYYNMDPNAELTDEVSINVYQLIDVEFDLTNFKTDYLRLDDLDTVDNIAVYGIYDDGTGNTIQIEFDSSLIEMSDLETDTLGETKEFSLSYLVGARRFVSSFSYSVLEPEAISVTLDSSQCQLLGYEGDVEECGIDFSNLTYTVTYENNKTETFIYTETGINATMTYTPVFIDDASTPGEYPFNLVFTHISHNGSEVFDLSVNAVVKENKVESLYLNTGNCQKVFYVGQEFNYDGLRVSCVKSVNNDFPNLGIYLTDDYTVTLESYELGENIVTVTYNPDPTIKAQYTITLKEDVVESYEFDGYDKEISQGSAIDLTGLFATAHYESGKTETINYEDLTITGNPSSANIGTTSFNVFYNGEKIGTCYINVLENTDYIIEIRASITEIKVQQGDEDTYNEKLSEVIYTGYYNESGEVELDSSKYKITGTVNINKIGTYTLKITSTEKSSVYTNIRVVVTEALKITSIDILSNYFYLKVGEDFDPETFLNEVKIQVNFNLQDSITTTLGDEMILYYYFDDPLPSVSTATDSVRYAIHIGVQYNGRIYDDENGEEFTSYIQIGVTS